ncbi:MAG: NAD(+) synthase [Candidatus Paceibacterota bacterium]
MRNLKVAIGQIDVVPGNIAINLRKCLETIEAGKAQGCELVVLPELATTGYLFGDHFENSQFCEDANNANLAILAASKGIAVIWGGLETDFSKKGEDGRERKYNAAFAAQNGCWVKGGNGSGATYKYLLPDYRFFNDKRYVYSNLQLEQSKAMRSGALQKPFAFQFFGEEVLVGVLICEDMWTQDYEFKPPIHLVDKGARVLVNVSMSPFSWHKNQTRHKVVSEMLHDCHVPLLYCNCVGLQNNLKNYIVFDGRSSVYDCEGNLSYELPLYEEKIAFIDLKIEGNHQNSCVVAEQYDDDRELYTSLLYANRRILERHMPNGKVVIGLSGGIDSAVSAALMVEAIGSQRVVGINMPTRFNSRLTRDLARELAGNLGIEYKVIPIQDLFEETLLQLQSAGVCLSDFDKQNVQARLRMQVLASLAAHYKGIFTCNANKTEICFGYSTLYGDVAGAYAPIGDCLKREVYQLAGYHNQVSERKIPQGIIEVIPSAELSDSQKIEEGKGDPFNYRYHDELVRAFIEFGHDPGKILQRYDQGNLESLLRLNPGELAAIFADRQAFASDLSQKWAMYKNNIFKHAQCPPIPIMTRRAFGFDLRECIPPNAMSYRSELFNQLLEK